MKYRIVALVLLILLAGHTWGGDALIRQSSQKGWLASDLPQNLPQLNKKLNYSIDIWIMMEAQFNEELFLSQLPKWYAPIERFPPFYMSGQNYDKNYTLNYNLKYFSKADILAYRDFIYSQASISWAPFFIKDKASKARYIPSVSVEDYFIKQSPQRPTMVFIDTYTSDPDGHFYYYYNASELNVGRHVDPRRYASMYQISGGGRTIPLLWYDYSAGPVQYSGEMYPFITDMDSSDMLATDMAYRLQKAIELRFIPSWLYEPIFSIGSIIFEFVLIDLDPSEYNFWDAIDINYILEKYKTMNPFVDWKARTSTFNVSSDQSFLSAINSAKFDSNHTYDADVILDYLDTVYTDIFNSSTPSERVIPVFLFGLPDDWRFDAFAGIAHNTNGDFTYIISSINRFSADPSIDLLNPAWYKRSTSITVGNYDSFSTTLFGIPAYFELNITSSDSVDVLVLTEGEFNKWRDFDSYEAVYSFPDVKTISHNISLNIYTTYYWVFSNPSGKTAQIDVNIAYYSDMSYGLTVLTMHEIGHAIGLSHPHDGWSWLQYYETGFGEFVDWQWDMSYTQMTYAADHREISFMDIQTYHRGIIPKIMAEIADSYLDIRNSITNKTQYVPQVIYEKAKEIEGFVFSIKLIFEALQSNNMPVDYQSNKFIDSYLALQAAREVFSLLQSISDLNFEIVLTFEGINGNPSTVKIIVVDLWTGKTLVNSSLSETPTVQMTWVDLNVTLIDLNSGKVVSFIEKSWRLQSTFDILRLFSDDVQTSSAKYTTSDSSPLPILIMVAAFPLISLRRRLHGA